MDIEQEIKNWVDEEIALAKNQGIKAKDMKKGIRVALFQLTKIAFAQLNKHVEKEKK